MAGNIAVGASAGMRVEEAEMRAVVTRCGCGDPLTIHERINGELQPCPTPRAVENKGRISYYHKNPLRRMAWAIHERMNRGNQQ